MSKWWKFLKNSLKSVITCDWRGIIYRTGVHEGEIGNSCKEETTYIGKVQSLGEYGH